MTILLAMYFCTQSNEINLLILIGIYRWIDALNIPTPAAELPRSNFIRNGTDKI
jgi:hypothetical protein